MFAEQLVRGSPGRCVAVAGGRETRLRPSLESASCFRVTAVLGFALSGRAMASLVWTVVLATSAVVLSVQAQDHICPNVISRERWGGRVPKKIDYMTIPLKYAIIQHTASPICKSMEECTDRVRSVEADHMDNRGWDDMGPSFLVGGDGNVYEGAGWLHVGAHTIGYNNRSVGIMLIGNFGDSLPPRSQLDAVKKLLECGEEEGFLAEDYKLLGHRQVSATQSPGLALFQEIQNWPAWSSRP